VRYKNNRGSFAKVRRWLWLTVSVVLTRGWDRSKPSDPHHAAYGGWQQQAAADAVAPGGARRRGSPEQPKLELPA
jgi:hypothetical protein